MRSGDGFDKLSAFYADLESVPTPELAIRPKRGLGAFSLILAPFGAALGAFLFISICCSVSSAPPKHQRVRILFDQYAWKRFQELSSQPVDRRHASASITTRGLI